MVIPGKKKGSSVELAGRPHRANFINLAEAYLCSDCEAVGNSANRCPRCQSSALIAITRAIPRHRDHIRLVCVPLDEQAA
jgi:hypothetical protein